MTQQQLAALAHFGLPMDLPMHDGRSTIDGQQVELRPCLAPPASLSLEGYARAAGAEEPSVGAPRGLVVVDVESRAGRVPVPRLPVPDGRTVPE